ncbi:SanA protein [Prosthecobacter fusiformis]|uniref:SanA protein n=1 Tax=Prosthecobacter fusiformis TaxID=48464 RepID=A0A4R7S0T9_9BACT|nr:ElyC/SanA/YdcF family protein [Prosthecobacter fusiformis]TDU70785.1 SanA protein [Prosthecobacter fusiformis]
MKRFFFRLSLKRLFVLLILGCAALVLTVWGSHVWVEKTAHDRCYDDVAKVPPMDVALVLGCSPRIGGLTNLFYLYRMEAAAALFRAGKVKAFIVSGDNSTHQYDEPTAMKESLIAAGVPAEAIHCDYAGFRTLDSVVRADAIFDQKRFIVVSQRFHNERAVFLARRRGLEAVGFNAEDVSRSIGLSTHLREYLARVNAVLDVTLLQTEPKFYGPKVKVR